MVENFEYALAIPLLTIAFSFCTHAYTLLPKKETKPVSECIYVYHASTDAPLLDHKYKFNIRKVAGQYRCYVVKKPSYRGRDLSHYTPHCWVDNSNNRYICWTGKIMSVSQAKSLCRKWGDATQQFIDSGIPAPGFER